MWDRNRSDSTRVNLKPLVSILIPAYNAEHWIADTIRSAVEQSWSRKEIIVVDDGSKDRTVDVARQFAAKNVLVVSKENQGAAATRNYALRLSQGDYIQWLDADDLLSPNKIEAQLDASCVIGSNRVLLSCPWAFFNYRPKAAQFVPTPLWDHLSPAEWLFRKLAYNLHMQTATWLTSRELSDAAGPWDIRLLSDDDGEYFCRVLARSERTRFVPEAKVFYRNTPSNRLGQIGRSDKKKEAMVLSMKLHIQYLRSLEESDRVRAACVTYLQNWFEYFYPERPDLVAQLRETAKELGGSLDVPRLRWKYAWIRPFLGWETAKWAQMEFPRWKASLVRGWDRAIYRFETRKGIGRHRASGLG